MVKIIKELNKNEKIISLYDKEKMNKDLNEYALKKSEEDGISKGRALSPAEGKLEESNKKILNIAKTIIKNRWIYKI